MCALSGEVLTKLIDTSPTFPELWLGKCSLETAARFPQSWQRRLESELGRGSMIIFKWALRLTISMLDQNTKGGVVPQRR